MSNELPFRPDDRPFKIADVSVEPLLNQIERNGSIVRIERKVMLLLLLLVQKSGCVLTRADILHTLWPDSSSNDEALTQAASKLRRALGDCPKVGAIIQTIHKVGYRLNGPVTYFENAKRASRDQRFTGPARRPINSQRRFIQLAIASIVTALLLNFVTIRSGESDSEPGVKMVRMVISRSE